MKGIRKKRFETLGSKISVFDDSSEPILIGTWSMGNIIFVTKKDYVGNFGTPMTR
jgi:hypothetical protein